MFLGSCLNLISYQTMENDDEFINKSKLYMYRYTYVNSIYIDFIVFGLQVMSRNLDWLKTINFLQAHYFWLFKKDKRMMNKTVDENIFMIDILEMPEITKIYNTLY